MLEELGRSLAPAPLLSSLVTAEALLAGADEDARQRLLPRIAAGEVAAFADGDRPVLDGDVAAIVVAATDDGLYEVERRRGRLGADDGPDHPARDGHGLGGGRGSATVRRPGTGPGWWARSGAPHWRRGCPPAPSR